MNSELTITAYVTIALLEAGLNNKVRYILYEGYLILILLALIEKQAMNGTAPNLSDVRCFNVYIHSRSASALIVITIQTATRVPHLDIVYHSGYDRSFPTCASHNYFFYWFLSIVVLLNFR